ncbi:Charged multivesicular body protein 7 [Rhizoclosmatium sp. JEL0117]|nr:Charged multivesicular body protein 7 [Rhizoclosmatium sp. JEL0117]
MTNQQSLASWASANLPEWNDNARMSALFSRFPERAVNEKIYESRLRFWTGAITGAAREGLLSTGNTTTIDASEIASRFARNGLTPLGLETVLTELRKSGALVPLSTYIQSLDQLDSESSWSLAGLVKSSVSFGFALVFGSTSTSTHDTDLVLLALAQEYGTRLVNWVKDNSIYSTDALQDESIFGKALPDTHLTQIDYLVLAQWLQETRKAVVKMSNGRVKAIKFLTPSSSTSSKAASTITESDLGVLEIKKTVNLLSRQIEDLEQKAEQLKAEAMKHLNANSKVRAKACLKQKAVVNGVLEKRVASLHTLDGILGKIQQAETDSEILKAYETGSSTLKSIIANSGVTTDRIDTVMDSLHDALADQTEIDEAFAYHNQKLQENVADDDELEKELDALVESDAKKEAAVSMDDELVSMLGSLKVESSSLPVSSEEPEKQKERVKEYA